MSTVNIGWLKDSNGEKFAPKTLSSQVINSDGIILEDVIQTKLNELVEDVIERFLDREYGPDGKGGLFTVRHCEYDLRDVEIWYQLCWYLDSIT